MLVSQTIEPWPWANPPKIIPLPWYPPITEREQLALPTPKPLSDRPEHYNTAIDPYAYALANDLGALEMNVVKYVTRWKKKDGLKDLKKAANTLQRLIAHAEEKIAERLHDRLGG